jgi:hypothetical protein
MAPAPSTPDSKVRVVIRTRNLPATAFGSSGVEVRNPCVVRCRPPTIAIAIAIAIAFARPWFRCDECTAYLSILVCWVETGMRQGARAAADWICAPLRAPIRGTMSCQPPQGGGAAAPARRRCPQPARAEPRRLATNRERMRAASIAGSRTACACGANLSRATLARPRVAKQAVERAPWLLFNVDCRGAPAAAQTPRGLFGTRGVAT